MTTKPQSTTEPTRKTVCGNCGVALYQTADPNNIHWYHEGTGDVRCPTRFAKPVPASAAPVVDEDAFHCENCEKRFTENPHATDDGYWLCAPCWSALRTEALPVTCTRAFPCRYRNARQCAHDTMLGSECPTICECACHVTAATAAPQQTSSDAWRRWFERLGTNASAEIVNATADLLTDERLAALVDAKVLPSAAAVEQSEWQSVEPHQRTGHAFLL